MNQRVSRPLAPDRCTGVTDRFASAASGAERLPGLPFSLNVPVSSDAAKDNQLKSLILAQIERWRHG